ncbi:hypothetical protein ACLB2K_061322 [Fragaria x ananassa]
MERDLILMWKKEPDAVFENLQRTRVMVKLEGGDRDEAIIAIAGVLKQIKEDAKRSVLLSIAYAVQQELYKSKEIDVETMKKVASYYPLCVEIDDDNLDEDWITAYNDFKLKPEEEEEEAVDADEDDVNSSSDAEADEAVDEDGDVDDEDWDFEDVDEDDPEEFKERGMNEIKKQCHRMGCSLKKGQEEEILGAMISFFREKKFKIYDEYTMKTVAEAFMSRVKGYISSTCILNDPNTVINALKNVEIRADDYAVHAYQQLEEKNTIPTNAEGIECGIATPFNLPEQEEICLTPPECENTITEDCWSATPMNRPEQEVENMVHVNLSLTPPGGGMKTEECTTRAGSKRKLAQL